MLSSFQSESSPTALAHQARHQLLPRAPSAGLGTATYRKLSSWFTMGFMESLNLSALMKLTESKVQMRQMQRA